MAQQFSATGILYSGNLGSFSWEAARRFQTNQNLDGPLIEALDPPTALKRWKEKETRHAVIAIFNNDLGGPVPSSLKALQDLNFAVPENSPRKDPTGNAWLDQFLHLNQAFISTPPLPLPIQFSIYGAPDADPKQIRKLAAYSMAIDQCHEGILREVGHTFEHISYSDTGKAGHDFAQILAGEKPTKLDLESDALHPTNEVAILGPTWFKDLFGLKPLWENVQNNPQGNTTFFILLTHPES